MTIKLSPADRRTMRVRSKIRKHASDRPRISVFRSSQHIYAQLIDDTQGATLVAASTVEKEVKASIKTGADVAAAVAVGKKLAERALAAGYTEVRFDRGGYQYHGRVKALAEAAREAGLAF